MVLFYAISKQSGKYQDIRKIVGNKAKRLLVPYYFVALLFLVPTIVLLHMNSHESNVEYLFDILLGSNCRHLWYLWALFEMFIIVDFCKGKYLSNPTLCMAIAVVLSVGAGYYEGADLFSFRMTMHYLPYFFLGEWMCEKSNDSLKIWKPVVIILLSGCMLKLTEIKWMDSFFSILMVSGIVLFVYLLAKVISVEKFFRIPYMTQFLKNSFGIYLFHVPLIYLLVYSFQNYSIYILLPIVGVAAIIGSILLSVILRKMRLQSFIGE